MKKVARVFAVILTYFVTPIFASIVGLLFFAPVNIGDYLMATLFLSVWISLFWIAQLLIMTKLFGDTFDPWLSDGEEYHCENCECAKS